MQVCRVAHIGQPMFHIGRARLMHDGKQRPGRGQTGADITYATFVGFLPLFVIFGRTLPVFRSLCSF